MSPPSGSHGFTRRNTASKVSPVSFDEQLEKTLKAVERTRIVDASLAVLEAWHQGKINLREDCPSHNKNWKFDNFEKSPIVEMENFSDRSQTCTVRFLYRKESAISEGSLGFDKLSAISMTFERGLPADMEQVPARKELLGCPWQIKKIRHYPKPEKIDQVESVEF